MVAAAWNRQREDDVVDAPKKRCRRTDATTNVTIFWAIRHQISEEDPSCRRFVVLSGKWMLFFPKTELDDAWNLAVSCLQSGEIPRRVTSVKVSKILTMNNQYSSPAVGAVVLRVEAHHRHEVIEDGQKIAAAMRYTSSTGRMYFKNDEETPLVGAVLFVSVPRCC